MWYGRPSVPYHRLMMSAVEQTWLECVFMSAVVLEVVDWVCNVPGPQLVY